MDFDANNGAGWTPWFNEAAFEPFDLPEIVVSPLPAPSSPIIAPPSSSYKAVYLGAVQTPIQFPVPGQLSGDQFRRETDNVMHYLETTSKSTGDKSALKTKVVISLNQASVVEALIYSRAGAKEAMSSSLDDVMAYRAGVFKIRGRKRHTAVLLCRSYDNVIRQDTDLIVCHRFVFKSKAAQAQFFTDLQNGFQRIAQRIIEETSEAKEPSGRPKVKTAWG
eukprot:m.164653 g.164653  ORF g.164653 m.164653 type:complete len:221 (+) comp14659_c0_seq5:236-898(+)